MADKHKVIVMTGSTGAIGQAIVNGVAFSNRLTKTVSRLILIVRNNYRGERIAEPLRSQALKVDVHIADLSRPSSVAACAASLCEKYPRIDVLVNCAAVAPPRREVTPDGLEESFATNVLAYFVLMRGLLPAMGHGGARVVLVASNVAGGLNLADLQSESGSYNVTDVYAKTKQANRMIAAEAAEPGRGFAEARISVTSCHPGVVSSTLLENLGFGTGRDAAASAAQTPLKLALGPAAQSGTFWSGKQQLACSFSADKAGRQALWEACERLSDQHATRGAGVASSSTK